ncbi:MAG: HAD family hydrolase [Eubacteriales bacterium]
MIKLIASDLDGTILQGKNHTVPEELINIINSLGKKGVHFVAASGRPYNNLVKLFEQVTVPMSFVSENGGMYVFNNKMYFPKVHTADVITDLTNLVRKEEDCYLMYSCKHTTYTEPKSQDFIDYMSEIVNFDLTLTDDLLSLEDMPMKLAICNPKGIELIEKKYKDLFQDRVHVITSGNKWLDFMPYGANKGNALEHITKMLHIAPEECMAFGDQWNDMEMLKFVGTSYAMANAVAGISDFCTHTTDSVIPVLKSLLETYPEFSA